MQQYVLQAIYKLKSYQMVGWMNVYQMEEVIKILQEGLHATSHQLMDKIMDDISTFYQTKLSQDEQIHQYVKQHMEGVSQLLKRSKRTIYRKLQNGTFTLVEKKMIQEQMNVE